MQSSRAVPCLCCAQAHPVVNTGTLLRRLPRKSSARYLTRATASCKSVFWTLRGQLGGGEHANACWVGARDDARRRGGNLEKNVSKKRRNKCGDILGGGEKGLGLGQSGTGYDDMCWVIETEIHRSGSAAWLISQSHGLSTTSGFPPSSHQ